MSDGLGHVIPHANGIVQDFKIENRWFPIRLDLGTHVFRLDLFRSLWGVSEATLKRHATGSNHDRPPPRDQGMNKEWTFDETLALVRQHMDEYKTAARHAAQATSGSKSQPTSPSNAEKQRLKTKQLKWVEKAEEYITQLRGCIDRIANGSEPSVGYGFQTMPSEKWIIPQDSNMVAKVLHVKPVKTWTSYDVTWFVNAIDRELKPPFQHNRMSMDGNKLCSLTAQDLIGLGVTNPDLQQKLISGVQNRVFYQSQAGNLIYYPPAEVQRDKHSGRLVQSTTGSKGHHTSSRHNSHGGHNDHKEHKHDIGSGSVGGASGNISALQVPGTTRIHLGVSAPSGFGSPLNSPLNSPLGKGSLKERQSPAIIPPSPSSAFLSPASSPNTTPTSTNSSPTTTAATTAAPSPSSSPAVSPVVSPALTSRPHPTINPPISHGVLLPSVPEGRPPSAAEVLAALDFNELKQLISSLPPPPPYPPAPPVVAAPGIITTTASGTPVKRPPPTTNAELLASVDFTVLTKFLATLPPPATPPPNFQRISSQRDSTASTDSDGSAASSSSGGPGSRGSPKSNTVAPPMPSSTFSTPMNSPPNSAPPTPTHAKSFRKSSSGSTDGSVSSPPAIVVTSPHPSSSAASKATSKPGVHYTAEILATVDFDELRELLSGLDDSAPTSLTTTPSAPSTPRKAQPAPAVGHVDSFSTPNKRPMSPVASLTPASPSFRNPAPVSSSLNRTPSAPANADLLATRDFNELNFLVQTTR